MGFLSAVSLDSVLAACMYPEARQVSSLGDKRRLLQRYFLQTCHSDLGLSLSQQDVLQPLSMLQSTGATQLIQAPLFPILSYQQAQDHSMKLSAFPWPESVPT